MASSAATPTSTRERPILFAGPMVRAILEGRKTQTRRVVNPQPKGEPAPLCEWSRGVARACGALPSQDELDAHSARLEGRVSPFRQPGMRGLSSPRCPYGAPGDTLWVRETHHVEAAGYPDGRGRHVLYRADDPGAPVSRWRPSIFMPRCASRLTLRVTGVRVERLQEISEEDARAEGVEPLRAGQDADGPIKTHRTGFVRGWDSINGKRAPWASDPYVWVVSFERVEGAQR